MFETLTEKQLEIVNKSGKFVVRACPGSGKTYCVAARLAKYIFNWKEKHKGVAALSFTNVAWQEIQHQINNTVHSNYSIDYPHYLGTIDSFINKYIFLPFGHLMMNCRSRPVMVGEPHQNWSYARYERDYRQYFDILTFDINNNLALNNDSRQFFFGGWGRVFTNNEPNKHYINLLEAKNELIGMGYANQSDANYFTMKLLEMYPCIAKSVVLRFPYFILDEAQDTSDIQMKIIELLIEHGGLAEVMMVGDPDQAIYEWNDAKPQLLVDKFNAWQGSIELNENRRSSQNICNFTKKLSSLQASSVAIDTHIKDYNFLPRITQYSSTDINAIINNFLDICRLEDIEINPQNVAVLVRGNSFIQKILGYNSEFINPWSFHGRLTKDILYGKFLIDNKKFTTGQNIIEKVYVKITKGLQVCTNEDLINLIEEIGFKNFKIKINNFVLSLPNTINISLNEWISIANISIEQFGFNYCLKINNVSDNIKVEEVFKYNQTRLLDYPYRLGTIHSVKGETFQAILLLLKKKSGDRRNYNTLINNNLNVLNNEELRVVYVGITRPRKILVLGVPEEDLELWRNKFS